MSEPSFTPGPWAFERAKMAVDDGFDHGIIAILNGKSTVIGEAYERVGEEICAPSKANAALIASAPCLYKALDQLLDDMGEDGLSVCQAAKEQAVAALRKARGEE